MKRKSIAAALGLSIILSTLSGCGFSTIVTTATSEESREHNTTEYVTEDRSIKNSDNSNSGKSNVSNSESGSAESPAAEADDYCTQEADYDYVVPAAESKVYAEAEMLGEEYWDCEIPENHMPYYYNTEEYTEVKENEFKSVSDNPLSTFSADVDTASYTNIRRMIEMGYRLEDIPEGAVRIEEMINYFDYSYAKPRKSEPFSVNTEISTCPWNENHQLMMLGLQSETIDFAEAPDSNLVFLIDVSGSMYDYNKLPLLKQAFSMLIDNLSEKDRVSIVTYAGTDEILLRGVPASNKNRILSALDSLEASGSTNGGQGIISAYNLAEQYFIEGGNNRIILATDGDFNVGITDRSDLYDLIDREKERGVYLSVLGFGMDNYSDSNMETLADAGNGNYAYIDGIKEARKVLVEELGATMVTVAKDVKFQVEFNPAVVKEYRLIGYENRALANRDFDDDTKDAGEIGAGHSVTVLYEIVLKDNVGGKKLKYQDNVQSNSASNSDEYLTVSIRYKEPDEDESKLLEYPVGNEAYRRVPSDDFVFASAVAEFGMILRHSEYLADGNLNDVISAACDIRSDDEYRQEFADLVQSILNRDRRDYIMNDEENAIY